MPDMQDWPAARVKPDMCVGVFVRQSDCFRPDNLPHPRYGGVLHSACPVHVHVGHIQSCARAIDCSKVRWQNFEHSSPYVFTLHEDVAVQTTKRGKKLKSRGAQAGAKEPPALSPLERKSTMPPYSGSLCA